MDKVREKFFEMVYDANTLRHQSKETFNKGMQDKEKGDVVEYQVAMLRSREFLLESDATIKCAKKMADVLGIEVKFDWALYAYVVEGVA